MAAKLPVLSDADVRARLVRELPHWRLEGDRICRSYRTENWKGALMVVNAIGHLAEAAWHHPDLMVSYAKVEVQLQTHDTVSGTPGVTELDLALALRIEDVIHWQPARSGGALEGTPNDAPQI